MTASNDNIRERIIAGIDVIAEYRKMGLNVKSDTPRASGKVECYSASRPDESKPSAWIDVNTGNYGAKGEKDPDTANGTLSIFDFAVKYGGHASFKTAYDYFAAQANVELPKRKRKKGPEDPYEKLDFEDWHDGNIMLATYWCMKHKPGTSVDALKACGARIARYPRWVDKSGEIHLGKNKCIALPCYGPQLLTGQPVAWVLWDISGRKLEVWRGKDVPSDYVKMKSCGPTAGTIMGEAAVRQLTTNRESVELVWKTAGPTDMLALYTAIPQEQRSKHVVICNASGEDGDVHHWNVELLTGLNVNIVHDADRTGELGSAKWTEQLAVPTNELRQVRLPYEIAEKGGLDIRHFFTEDAKTYADLLVIASEAKPVAVVTGEGTEKKVDDATAVERQIMSMIRLDVLGQLERGGIKVFSEFHRKTEVIPDADRMNYGALLRIAGPVVKERVLVSKSDDTPGMFGLDEVRHSIALLGGYKRIGDQTELGAGCWRGLDANGIPHPSVVIVGSGEAAEWNGALKLEQIRHPRCKGHLLDFDSSTEPWYDHDTLSRYLKQCDRDFAITAMNETMALYDLFCWKHPASPVTLTGLTIATWVQTFWDWRPQVGIVGPTHAGKTTFFNLQSRLFGNLTIKSSHSSAAGIRQAVKNTAKVILCDEFESSKHRADILEMLRMSGRGDKMLRGTSDQRGLDFGLQHIAWVAAIELGLKRAPDRNRFIMLDLKKPGEHKKQLALPNDVELKDLGQRLLAVAIKYVHEARTLAIDLKHHCSEGVDARIVESYTVPAAMLAAIQGMKQDQAHDLLHELLAGVDRGHHKDESNLIDDIFEAIPIHSKSKLAVGQLLQIVLSGSCIGDTCVNKAVAELESVGIKIGTYKNDGSAIGRTGNKCLILNHAVISRYLLRDTIWANQDIRTFLLLLPGATDGRRRVCGNSRVVLLGEEVLQKLQD